MSDPFEKSWRVRFFTIWGGQTAGTALPNPEGV